MEKYNKVLPIYEKEYRHDSMEMARLLNNMATALAKQGKYENAEEKYQLSSAIEEKLLGLDHQQRVDTRYNIALVQEVMQRK